MALRLIELYLPAQHERRVDEVLENDTVADVRRERVDDETDLVRVLIAAENVEPILDSLQNEFGGSETFRIILTSVEATLPRIEKPEQDEGEDGSSEGAARATRISREELYSQVTGMSRLTLVYLLMVALSTVVAATGMLQDNVAVVIGAMVIAPLLGPNMALALASTLADPGLGRAAIKSLAGGLAIGIGVALAIGMVLTVDPTVDQIAGRTRIGLSDVSIALASGGAGALALTTGLPAILVGVMVAVALLPPLVTVGLMLGSGYTTAALTAFLLLVTNIICINLTAVTTFRALGLRPRTWWETEKARKSSRIALLLWAGSLAALVAVLLLYGEL